MSKRSLCKKLTNLRNINCALLKIVTPAPPSALRKWLPPRNPLNLPIFALLLAKVIKKIPMNNFFPLKSSLRILRFSNRLEVALSGRCIVLESKLVDKK